MTPKLMGSAAVILDTAGRVLMVKHSYGRLNWELPGGAAEANESPVETALREVREETGLEVVAKYTANVYYDTAEDFVHFVFVCDRVDASAEPRPDLAEITACGFWPVDRLPRPISTFTVQRIKDALTGKSWPLPTLFHGREWLE
jgi:8-oxo-dGTP pyrophosphatase MutT (NUDIX family)